LGLTRSRTLYLVLLLGLAFLSLRPIAPVEYLLDAALLPSRALAELGAPIAWLQSREVRASSREQVAARERELAASAELERSVLASVVGERTRAGPEALWVHGEVVGRDREELDRIRVRLADDRGAEVGMPVVSGEFFVGLVSRVPGRAAAASEPAAQRHAREIEVQLITGADARIGALVVGASGEPEAELVAGGIAPPVDAIYLDVHHPSRSRLEGGAVVVDEPAYLAGEHTPLANGYLLGELERVRVARGSRDERTLLCIRPGLDYAAGLYQVLVLVPRGAEPPADPGADPLAGGPLEDPEQGAWRGARLFLRSELSPWREGRKLALGRRHGVALGSALASGARLAGRVTRAGPLSSDVRLLGDPGVEVAALAMIGDVPHVMGRIVGLGRSADGSLRFRWEAAVPIEAVDGASEVPATVWTGSGEHGVPRGLLLGETRLPCGRGPHTIRLRQPAGAREPRDLSVWTGPAGPLELLAPLLAWREPGG